jgi:hypothetical protein
MAWLFAMMRKYDLLIALPLFLLFVYMAHGLASSLLHRITHAIPRPVNPSNLSAHGGGERP